MNGKVSILYGLWEGPMIGKAFVKELKKKGFEVINDASKADIIIAHSGGVLLLPKIHTAKTILLVGVTDRFEGSLLLVPARKVKIDLMHALKSRRHWYWLYRSIWNILYIAIQVKKTLHMWQIVHLHRSLLPTINNAKVLVISYKDDPWSGNISEAEIKKYPHYKFITRIGIHDDLWINPDYYINLLQALQF